MENNSKKNLPLSSTLPEELILEILLRLPVRSLLRFKCVCKTCLSLISDPQFAASHFALAASPTHRLLHIPIVKSTHLSIKSIDIEAPLHDHSSQVNLFLPPLPIPTIKIGLEILGSCRGLVILLHCKLVLVVWNPSTNLHKQLSPCPHGLIYRFAHCFGYDLSTNDYFVVFMAFDHAVRCTLVEFYSFRTNSWSYSYFQGDNFLYYEMGYQFKAGLIVHKALHWLLFSRHSNVVVIVGFDWIERELYEIPLPLDLIMGTSAYNLTLREMEGCLSVCYPRDAFEIWVMKEYRVLSSWTKTVIVSPCPNIPFKFLFPVCFTKGGWIFSEETFETGGFSSRLVKLDDKGEMVEDLRLERVKDWGPVNLPRGLYTESLLPIPG